MRDLRTAYFPDRRTVIKAVDGVSFHIERGAVLGIAGESGCGKSTIARSVLNAVDRPGRIVGGQVLFHGRDLLQASERELRAVRGRRIGIVVQDPVSGFDPLFTIGAQMLEVIQAHLDVSRAAARERTLELLRRVRISDPPRRMAQYPHELSGGMRQRIMLAMALSCEPELLIADEPTSALDTTLQAEMLELMREARKDYGTAILLISHSLGVLAALADRVAVMYAGRVIEEAPAAQLLRQPRHPYTAGLIASVPLIESRRARRLLAIPGFPPDLARLPPGCPFSPRCGRAEPGCRQARPELLPLDAEHRAACYVPLGS